MHPLTRRLMPLLLSAAVALPLRAARVEYRVRTPAGAVAGAEVCFFPAGAVDDFDAQFFGAAEPRCVSADQVVHLPAGMWNVYAEAPGLVSAHPLVTEAAQGEDENRLFRAAIDVYPAAFVDFSALAIAAGERAAVYLHNDTLPLSRAALRPARAGAARIAVPAGVTIVPLLLRDHRPAWVGQPRVLRAGESWRVPRGGDASAVVALTIPRALLPSSESVDPPSVELQTADGQSIAPRIGIRAAPLFAGSLLFFRSSSGGAVVLTGTSWLPDRVELTRTDAGVWTAPRALRARRRPRLHAAWSVAAGFLAAPQPSCSQPSPQEPLLLSLLPSTAKSIQQVELRSAARGEHVFADLDPGTYRLELRRGAVAASSPPFALDAGANATVAVDLAPGRVSGRLTRAGKPLHATIRFRTGSAVSDELTGEYSAYVADAPGLDRVRITPCSDARELVHVPSAAIDRDARYDIDLPSNAVHVHATSAATGQPVAGAAVYVNSMGGRGGDVELDQRLLDPTDASGDTMATDVSANVDVTICAYKKDFASQCTARRRFAADENARVALAMQPVRTLRGRMQTNVPVIRGRLFLVRARGVIASAAVAEDGSFSLTAAPAPADTLYFTARSHPLFVIAAPASDELLLPLPAMPVRTFAITCSGCRADARSPIGILIGGEPVPEDVLAFHQSGHGGQIALAKGERTLVADVPAALPIVVVKGLAAPDLPPQFAGVTDQFASELLPSLEHVAADRAEIDLP
jgi:hypothetical protein